MKEVIGAQSPQISFTKIHALDERKIYYFMYINGRFEGCYTFEEAVKKFQEVMINL